MKLRHKPTVTGGERYDGPGTLSPEFAAAICQPPCPLGGDRYENGVRLPHIDTRHGPVQLETGWWVLREPVGDGFYPVEPALVEGPDAIYEQVPDEPAGEPS